MDVSKASLTAGTLFDASKIRAMDIINELASLKCSIFGGASGYISWPDNRGMAIVLATAAIKEGIANIQASAGKRRFCTWARMERNNE